MAVWRTTESLGEPLVADGPGRTPEETAQRLRHWGDNKDLDRIVSLFSADVVFDTPITDEFRLVGRDGVRFLLGVVFDSLDDIRFHTDYGDGMYRVVAYRGVVQGHPFDEVILLRFNDRNEISEAVATVRPLDGLLKLSTLVGPHMIHRNGRRGIARGSALFLRFLYRVWAFINRTLVPLCSPGRARKIS